MPLNNSDVVTPRRNPIKWAKDAWHLARPYWTSEEKWRAIGLVTGVIILNLLTVYMSVLFNKWNNSMYDSLQEFNKVVFYKLIMQWVYIAFFYILFQILAFYLRSFLEIRWRRWMTRAYLENWLKGHAYYKTRFVENAVDNPDQRISQDIGAFISSTLGFTLGIISNVVSLFSFVFILWGLSGPISFMLAGNQITIGGYMVWAALLYAIIGTYITFKIGRPLVKLNFKQETLEADFRFGLMRVREYGENIAFYNGEEQERQGLLLRFNGVVNNFFAIVYRQMKINIFNTGYSQIANIFPLLVAAPRYFAKVIKLGDLMQIASAFSHVQDSLSFFIDSYSSLASWRAVMDRLYGFKDAISQAQNLPVLEKHEPQNEDYLRVHNLAISLPDASQPLLSGLSFSLSSGQHLLIKGASGSGKTTLLRSLAGLWPYVSGEVFQNKTKRELFVAQRPYLPSVSLRATICYPLQDNLPTDAQLELILHACGIDALAKRLDEVAEWGKILSLGEQQRIAFARVLVNQPDIIYLDEATSAVDEEMEAQLYQVLIERLPASAIISVGHRSTLAKWHNQELNFNSNREFNG